MCVGVGVCMQSLKSFFGSTRSVYAIWPIALRIRPVDEGLTAAEAVAVAEAEAWVWLGMC